MFPKSKTYQKGMTIIELLIVVAIMSILLGISFWGYNKRGDELILRRTTYQVISDIEKTREMAMSARKTGAGDRPEGGYGINFNTASPGQYIIFADLGAPPDKVYSGSPEAVETISLDSKIFIKDLNIGLSPESSIDVVFRPPSPDIYINTQMSGSIPAEITLALKNNPSKTRKIFVNSAGLVWTSD